MWHDAVVYTSTRYSRHLCHIFFEMKRTLTFLPFKLGCFPVLPSYVQWNTVLYDDIESERGRCSYVGPHPRGLPRSTFATLQQV